MVIAFYIFAAVWLASTVSFSFKWSSKEDEKKVELKPKEKIEKFSRIGSMNAPFNSTMHICDIYGIPDKSYSVGDVIVCNHPDCGKEYILGWFLSSNPLNSFKGYTSEAVNMKRWVPMEDYEKSPGDYVYSK